MGISVDRISLGYPNSHEIVSFASVVSVCTRNITMKTITKTSLAPVLTILLLSAMVMSTDAWIVSSVFNSVRSWSSWFSNFFSFWAPNIPNLATKAGLTTLVDFVTRAGLATTLSNPWASFTVFAPTNQAFSALPGPLTSTLLANTTALAQVLTYHVLKGRVTSGHLRNEMVTKTVQGGPLRINTYPNGVVTAQCAPIDLSRVNQRASNGIVHVLNSAMIPPQGTIVDLVVKDSTSPAPQFSTLLAAVQAADLAATLAGDGPFTVFAPTNDAFAKVDPATLNRLLADPAALAQVLTYHVVSGTFCSAGLTSGAVPTVNGEPVQVQVGNGVTVGGANVIAADQSVTNGVVHVIDTVLIPSTLTFSS